MHDILEIEPIDAEVMAEIRLTVNLMIAAATTRDHLDRQSIDRVLGVDRSSGQVSSGVRGRVRSS